MQRHFQKIALLIGILLCTAGHVSAQELNCQVEINADQIQNVNKDVFTTLKTAISEYVNNNKWGNAQFMTNEKIECRLYFTITSYEDNVMSGDLQVQSMRPVYNSSYTTTLLNFKDSNIEFTYQENDQLVFSETTMENNLTALLNFYCYYILALDFDSFSFKGGDPYFEKAAQVVNLAQTASEKGWKTFEDNKNRSGILTTFTDPPSSKIRELYYQYHRLGLDQMETSMDKGKAVVTKSLNIIKEIYDAAPMSSALSIFKDAKLDELVNIYSKADASEKSTVYDILSPIYPTETTRLQKIKEQSSN